MRIRRFDNSSHSAVSGAYGTASSGMRACSGVREPLRRLHGPHAVATFSHTVLPHVGPTVRARHHVIAGQRREHEALAAVQAQVLVATVSGGASRDSGRPDGWPVIATMELSSSSLR